MRCPPSLLALLLACATQANATALSLDDALASAATPHPDLMLAEAQADLARTEQQFTDSQNDFRLTLDGGFRTGRNDVNGNDFESDNQIRLNLRKTLWDGQRTRLASEAANLENAGRTAQVLDARAQRRLAVMNRFFDVLLADQRYAADNEFSAVAYVGWDNARERHALGELSNVDLARYDAAFQEARLKRNATLREAREKRALLATVMNRPGELPSELIDPDLKTNDHLLPEFDTLLATLERGNPRLIAHRQLLAAAQKRIEVQRADNLPSLEFETEAAAYDRPTSTRDEVRAGLNFNWPLWQGKRQDARVAREQARFRMLQAEHEQLRLALRQALYETREEIAHLRETERPAAKVNADMRDWNLERSRAEYELELKTNIGTSMAETQNARMRRRAVEYRLALAWEKLDALLGQPVASLSENKQP